MDSNLERDLSPEQRASMVWVSEQLKRRYGQHFSVTMPAAPWRPSDHQLVIELQRAGVFDAVMPQYYGHDSLTGEGYVVRNLDEWIARVGGDASKVGAGFRIGESADTVPLERARRVVERVRADHGAFRGAFVWELEDDATNGWRFADTMRASARRG